MPKQSTRAAAERLVKALEDLDALAPFADALSDAGAAVAALQAEATDTVFPPAVAPTDAAVLAALEHHTAVIAPRSYGRELADLHARSLASWPDLADAIRTPNARARIVAAIREERRGRPATSMIERQIEAFEVGICRVLAAAEHPLSPAAGDVLAALELERRTLDEAKRRELAAAAELARIESEAAAAERALKSHRALRAARLAELEEERQEAVGRLQIIEAEALSERVAGASKPAKPLAAEKWDSPKSDEGRATPFEALGRES